MKNDGIVRKVGKGDRGVEVEEVEVIRQGKGMGYEGNGVGSG